MAPHISMTLGVSVTIMLPPYFFFEPELCFVALDENGTPSGYIVGTSDTASFTSWFQKSWLPPLQEHYKHQQEFKSEAEEAVIKNAPQRSWPGDVAESWVSCTLTYRLTSSSPRKRFGAKSDGNIHNRCTRKKRCSRHSPWCGWPEHPCIWILREDGFWYSRTTELGLGIRKTIILISIHSPFDLQVFQVTGKPVDCIGKSLCTFFFKVFLLSCIFQALHNRE